MSLFRNWQVAEGESLAANSLFAWVRSHAKRCGFRRSPKLELDIITPSLAVTLPSAHLRSALVLRQASASALILIMTIIEAGAPLLERMLVLCHTLSDQRPSSV
jgi:hypothetical protein